ncbi:hypothetical protein AAFF_G00107880 [Aldrovandia affinis]|uniref:Uncharacterized protein n=1 Tax=Aldrovandia affinis TaxID=143900 RepID=A0AAD7RU12_9TELE|nr:hypothetical protein AAFF_G00107880 [Aldrovandia affinis]
MIRALGCAGLFVGRVMLHSQGFTEPAPRERHKAPQDPLEARVTDVPQQRSRQRRRLTTAGWHFDHLAPRSGECQLSLCPGSGPFLSLLKRLLFGNRNTQRGQLGWMR